MKEEIKIGSIIRHGAGPTALMQVTHISENHGGIHDRYYGKSFYGTSVGAYAYEVRLASAADLECWERQDEISKVLRAKGIAYSPIRE